MVAVLLFPETTKPTTSAIDGIRPNCRPELRHYLRLQVSTQLQKKKADKQVDSNLNANVCSALFLLADMGDKCYREKEIPKSCEWGSQAIIKAK